MHCLTRLRFPIPIMAPGSALIQTTSHSTILFLSELNELDNEIIFSVCENSLQIRSCIKWALYQRETRSRLSSGEKWGNVALTITITMTVTVIWYWNLVYMFWSNFNTDLNLIFLFFFGMFMYGNEFETMGNKIGTKDRIELQEIHTQGSWWFK